MKLAIMQPYFFPYIGYFQLINAVDKIILYGNVSFRKKSFISRNSILEQPQKKVLINLPINRPSSFSSINSTTIDNSTWKRPFLKRIQMTYARSPQFKEVYALLCDLLANSDDNVHRFNVSLISGLCDYMGIKTTISSNDEIYQPYEEELNLSSLSDFSKKTSRILRIMQHEEAAMYINPIGGRDLYGHEDFRRSGKELKFISPESIEYEQFKEPFVPNLSIIDVLMFNTKSEITEYLNRYSLD